MSWFRRLRGHLWFVRKFGPLTYAQYERVRRERGEVFDPKRHGERMLRAVGASEEQIELAKTKGLA